MAIIVVNFSRPSNSRIVVRCPISRWIPALPTSQYAGRVFSSHEASLAKEDIPTLGIFIEAINAPLKLINTITERVA